jgi:hypothetical protein
MSASIGSVTATIAAEAENARRSMSVSRVPPAS